MLLPCTTGLVVEELFSVVEIFSSACDAFEFVVCEFKFSPAFLFAVTLFELAILFV